MKLNIAYPVTGCQKVLSVDDDRKLRAFFDKRISQEVDGEALGDDFKGYVFKISGGNDKEGFAMKQGVITNQRVRLLLSKGHSLYRPRKRGERKRKSVRGCIVSGELSVLNLVVVKKGEQEIPGLTDTMKPRRLGPKRASRIRKLFNLEKEDDVRKYVIRRQIVKGEKKPYFKAPRIQRLVTPQRLQRRRQFASVRRTRYEAARAAAEEYNKVISARYKEQREKRQEKLKAAREGTGKEEKGASTTTSTTTTAASPKKDKPKKPKKSSAKKSDAPKTTDAPKAAAKSAASPSKKT